MLAYVPVFREDMILGYDNDPLVINGSFTSYKEIELLDFS